MCRQIRAALEGICMPPLQACGEAGLLDPSRLKDAFRLLSAYIEHQTLWYGLLVSPTGRNPVKHDQVAQEAVRITLSAYPPRQVEAFAPFDGDAQSVVGIPLRSHRAPKD